MEDVAGGTSEDPQTSGRLSAPRSDGELDVAADLVAAAISLPPEAILETPQVVSTGLPFCITLVRDHEALTAARLDLSALEVLGQSLGADGIDVMEPFLVSLGGATSRGDTYSRLLMAPPSPPEDPFTGSATGAMASYLWHHGLMDKASFTAEQRTKEIGIRKVMGASVTDIVRLLVWQFSKPVLVANLIAWPIAISAMLAWLESFPYRIDTWILLPLCVVAGAIALTIAWVTVGGNAARVARANPVDALRYE